MSLTQSCKTTDTAWIEQVKDLLIVDLKERSEDADMSLGIILTYVLNLLEQFFNTSLCYTMMYLSSIVVRHFTLVTFHSKRFTTACLAVSKYGAMISVNYPINKSSYT